MLPFCRSFFESSSGGESEGQPKLPDVSWIPCEAQKKEQCHTFGLESCTIRFSGGGHVSQFWQKVFLASFQLP